MAETINDRYRARTAQSRLMQERAERVLPGGDTRSAAHHQPYPLTLAQGAGPRVWDVDGNEYLDLLGNYTSLVHGHAYPPIIEAAGAAMADGTAWPARNRQHVELAELLTERVESVEQLRFCNSGSEAAMIALQAARAATGRPKLLMARYGYHGSHEWFEEGTYDGLLHVPGADHTLLVDWGDTHAFEAMLEHRGHDIAAVFLEPVLGSGGVVTAPREFFQRVEAAARQAGSLLVADEVITFRLTTGGAQASLGIRPDLTLFGKVIGGGFPVGALGGSREAMKVLDPGIGRLQHSGTFNGNPVTCAAGLVSVRELTAERIDALDGAAARLAAGFQRAAGASEVPCSLRRAGSLLNLYLTDEPPPLDLNRPDAELMGAFHLAALNNGLFLAPRGLMAMNTVMTAADLEEAVERAALAFGDVAAMMERQR